MLCVFFSFILNSSRVAGSPRQHSLHPNPGCCSAWANGGGHCASSVGSWVLSFHLIYSVAQGCCCPSHMQGCTRVLQTEASPGPGPTVTAQLPLCTHPLASSRLTPESFSPCGYPDRDTAFQVSPLQWPPDSICPLTLCTCHSLCTPRLPTRCGLPVHRGLFLFFWQLWDTSGLSSLGTSLPSRAWTVTTPFP